VELVTGLHKYNSFNFSVMHFSCFVITFVLDSLFIICFHLQVMFEIISTSQFTQSGIFATPLQELGASILIFAILSLLLRPSPPTSPVS
jgi:hypothetical protein